jgi:hypothetical protein
LSLVFQGAAWVLLVAGGALSIALHGRREVWFWFFQILLVVGFFAARWTRLRVPPVIAVALVVAVEAVAVVLAFA